MSKEIDIVSRLLEGSSVGTQLRWVVTDVHREAASEITRLRGEVERLMGVVASYACGCALGCCETGSTDDEICGWRARQALNLQGE